jgi:peptidoglycan hydrolase-like protein with peptidoglycan-binding domain
MILEKVIWTALPDQYDPERRLRLSLHIAPRISNVDRSSTPRELGDCPAFVDWPARLRTFRFRVEFDGAPARPGLPDLRADSALYRRLFPPKTPLEPFVFQDNAARDLHVFPVRDVHRFLRESYGSAAAAGVNPPSIDDPSGPLSRFVPLEHLTAFITDSRSFWQELNRAPELRRRGSGAVRNGRVVREEVASPLLPASEQAAQNAFFEAYRFYYRPGSQRPDLPADYVEPSPDPPDLDFHQRVTSFADHPAMLRMLGLVLDLVVDMEDPSLVPATGRVRVVPEGDLPETPPICPWTEYERDDRWFGARPRSRHRMHRGLLNLSSEFWELFQVDVDGAALQVVGFADTLRRMRDPERRNQSTPDAAAVPALRSAGLALARVRRGEQLLEDLRDRRRKNELIEEGQPPVLAAEDLVRGYRVDVHDTDAPGGGRWFSLHKRIAQHEVARTAPDEERLEFRIADEGYVKATSASSEREDHPSPSDDLYLHETVFGWEGWSLAAPLPGKRIVEPGQGDGGSSIARYDPAAGNPLLVTRVGVEPRTLPRLRVGRRYRMRARTVDLAGNSRPFTPEDLERDEPALVSAEAGYLRFEPVPSPTVLRRHQDTEGESLEHLVIRSDLGVSAADYAAEDSQRHLAPPKGSEQMAEQAGLLDAAFGGSPAAMTAALRTALREEGTFLDPMVVNVATGQRTVSQSTIQFVPPGTPLPSQRGAGLPEGAYAFYPDASVVLPYLPDPFAIGVSLTGYDYSGNVVLHQVARFGGAWPSLEPFRIRLSEGPRGVAFADGVLQVSLPQSEVVYARLASVFPGDRLSDFAIWSWIPEPLRTAALETTALEGRHYMLTPFRWLTLTHAVQRPLAEPDLRGVRPTRGLGKTYADFHGPIANHAKSTGRLDVFAEWTEDVDILTDDAPRMRAFGTAVFHQSHAFGFDIEPTEDQAETSKPGRAARHELGDTKYRRVWYHSVATTRFREFLPRPIAEDETRIQSVEPTKGTALEALAHDVLSAARPAAPEVAYLLPTFRWERKETPTRRHVRRGGAVRVWLRRPWFSSGDGEQLAVVLEPAVRLPHGWEYLSGAERLPPRVAETPLSRRIVLRPSALGTMVTSISRVDAGTPLASAAGPSGSVVSDLEARLAPRPSDEDVHRMLLPYVTAWGIDPIWLSSLPHRSPIVDDFPRRVGSAADLTLEELPEAVHVVVAIHDVYYDRARKLWYSDIEIDAGGSYFPFVRLALARYQPHSVGGAHLSRVTMTDFIQLAPDRTAEVTIADGTAFVTVQGFSGRNYVADAVAAASFPSVQDVAAPTSGREPNTMMRVALQRRTAGVPGDLGWESVGAEITLAAAASESHVTWSGSVVLPAAGAGSHRLLVTESETYIRSDLLSGDPNRATSDADFLRERIVYADLFELARDIETETGALPFLETAEPARESIGEPPLPEAFDYGALPTLARAADPRSVDAHLKLAQAMLNAALPGPPLVVDGNFGALTQAAVRTFQTSRWLPSTGVIDRGTWFALALASPFPLLEPGPRTPPMAGPPVALVQRQLNLGGGVPPLSVDGSFSPEVRLRVQSFQTDEGLPPTGKVTRETWLALSRISTRNAPTATMRLMFSYDSEDWPQGPLVRFVAREDFDAAAPLSDALDVSTEGRSGFWYELQDPEGQVLYRRVQHRPIRLVAEVPSGDPDAKLVSIPIDAPKGTFELLAPVLPRARKLVLFSSPLSADREHEAATAIGAFDLGPA